MVINAVDNNRFGPGGRTQHLHHDHYGGDTAFDRFVKTTDFTRLRNCRSRFLDIRSKKVNANDNFANDNFEPAFAAKAAIA